MQLADAMRKKIKNLMRYCDIKPYDLSRAAFNISLKEFFDDSVFKDVILE